MKIYLASRSAARKKILKSLGLKFKALPSRFKEKKYPGLTFAQIAKRNALEKAKEVSTRVDSGLIIAADTITVSGGKIFGKPQNLKEARAMLKKLSKRTQIVYSGVAVIDKDKNRARVACEKTKVYMDPLTDKQIEKYFAHTSPLDKAGSFDIQGKGAFFIRRVEGCFYNVVGLPLRKLYRMLRELEVEIFLVLFCFTFCIFLSGCSTEYNIATGQEESFYYSTDKEVQMGTAIARQVETELKFAEDPLVQKRVEDIGKKIAAVCDRKDIDYHFMALQDDEVNAVSLPGGFIYINSGLIEKTANDDELAGVIAHEVGHIVARHSIKKLQAMQGYTILRVLIAAASQGSPAGSAADAAYTQLMLGYSREDELLADQLGARYAKLAGYNPRAMITFLVKLQEINRRKPLTPYNYFKTHPYVLDRIRVVKQELGEGIDFKDYINIEQTPHQ